VSEELGNALLRPVGATSYDARRWWRPVRAPQGSDPALNGPSFHNAETDCAELANLLETRSFACVPYSPNDALVGRLYIMSSSKSFSNADTQFLAHVARQMASAANNGLVTEALAVSAAQHERSKISRDIHDTTVQSYIGLKLGLEALYRDMGIDGPAASRIKELLDMATLTVDDLRGYVERLRERESQQGDAKLLARIDEQRRRFETLHGIQVKVRADEALALPDGAAGTQAYQVVCEALSNIVRHTSAKQAFVDLRCNGETLAIEVGNDCAQNQRTAAFIPRSITERAVSLGGKVQVRLNNQGQDVVRVTIPLGAKLQLAAYAG